jgi:hypothetical protein
MIFVQRMKTWKIFEKIPPLDYLTHFYGNDFPTSYSNCKIGIALRNDFWLLFIDSKKEKGFSSLFYAILSPSFSHSLSPPPDTFSSLTVEKWKWEGRRMIGRHTYSIEELNYGHLNTFPQFAYDSKAFFYISTQ